MACKVLALRTLNVHLTRFCLHSEMFQELVQMDPQPSKNPVNNQAW